MHTATCCAQLLPPHASLCGLPLPAPAAALRKGARPAQRECTVSAAGNATGFGSTVTSKGKSRSSGKAWGFEQLMLAWDDVFMAVCEDSERAAEIFEVARHGHAAHGRGCVYVRAKLKERFTGGGRGAKAARQRAEAGGDGRLGTGSGEVLSTNANLLLEGWSAVYVPAQLLRPLGQLFTERDGVELPEDSGLVSSPTAPASEQGHGVSPAAADELQRTLRGMDNARLLTLTGLLPDGVEGSGEAPYDPGNDELVLLLSAKFDGRPSVGADLVESHLQDDGTLRLSTPGLQGLR